jgi:hypothetical protein
MLAKLLTPLLIVAACFGSLAPFQPEAQAVPITTLNNTGTVGGVAIVGTGIPDPNYSFVLTQSNPLPVTVDDTNFPIFGGPWFPNNGGSRWIGPAGDSQGPGGAYIYRTNFFLPNNADLNSVNVMGLWGTDDWFVDILINTFPTGATNAGFTTLQPFSITSNFVYGNNTIDFSLINAGGPTGLRVDEIKGSYNRIPEPGSLCLASIALATSLVVAGRRLRGPTA